MMLKRSVYFLLLVMLCIVSFSGCGEISGSQKQGVVETDKNMSNKKSRLSWSKEDIDAMNLLPNVKNTELGIELPPNIQTDWEIETDGGLRYVVFYQDPHKKGNPPYKMGQSPDVENMIFMDDYDMESITDKFSGYWVTGINELVNGTVQYSSTKVSYGDEQSFSLIEVTKIDGSNDYSIIIYNYIVNSLDELKVDVWRKQGKKALDVFLSDGGYQCKKLNNRSDAKVDGNIISAKLYDNDVIVGSIRLEYIPENNTMKIKYLDVDEKTKKELFYNLLLRKHGDILKRYSTKKSFDEFLSGLVQLKIDVYESAVGGDKGHRNLMLNYPHKKVID